jgi:hypothetical protein
MFEKFKDGYANLKLKQESSRVLRERTDPDIHCQAKIGILYDATCKDDFEVVKEFYRDLKLNQKAPVSLGYIDYLEPTFHPLARPESDYFFRSQVNWYKKPTGPIVENFIDEPFDILINLSLIDFYPLDYIAAVSKAGLKIGRANSNISFCYDMSFFLDENATLKSFAYLIIHYLSNINHDRPTQSSRNRSSHYYSV